MNEAQIMLRPTGLGALAPVSATDFELIQNLSRADYVATLKEGGKRSHPQNGMYWATLGRAVRSSHLQDTYPQPYHLHRSLLLGTGHTTPVINPTTGEVLEAPDSTAFRNKPHAEFTAYFNQAMPLLSELLGFDALTLGSGHAA